MSDKTYKQAVSSVTGKFVSKQYALENPDTTYFKTVKVQPREPKPEVEDEPAIERAP